MDEEYILIKDQLPQKGSYEHNYTCRKCRHDICK